MTSGVASMRETTRWTNFLGAALLLLGTATGIADAHESSLGTADRIEALCRPQIDSPCIARVSASLRSASSGNPLPGKTLRFVAGDTVICTAVTDAAGTTSCFGVARSGRDLAES